MSALFRKHSSVYFTQDAAERNCWPVAERHLDQPTSALRSPTKPWFFVLLFRHQLHQSTLYLPGVVNVDAMFTLLILSSSCTDELDELEAAAGRCGFGEMMLDMVSGYVISDTVMARTRNLRC